MFSLCQGASVYISTLSLTAIALDRLKLMTHMTARWWINARRNSDTVSVTFIQFLFSSQKQHQERHYQDYFHQHSFSGRSFTLLSSHGGEAIYLSL